MAQPTVVPASVAADCGSSYGVSGTNFAPCLDTEVKVKGLKGEETVSMPTHPQIPATEVVFDGGTAYHVTIGNDGKENRLELLLKYERFWRVPLADF